MKWDKPTPKKPEVVLCPKCGQPGGVQLFTSISPCDRCLNPAPEPAYEDTDPFGIFTLSNAQPALFAPANVLGPILSVTASSYGSLAMALILPAGLNISRLTHKFTTHSLIPNHAPLLTYNRLPDHSWAIHVAGVSSVLSKITVGELLYSIP